MVCVGRASFTAMLLRVKVGGVSHRLDNLHIAGAAANVAAERGADIGFTRTRIAAQESRRRHDEARRAIAALRAELFMEPSLHGRKPPILAERFDGIDARARDARG